MADTMWRPEIWCLRPIPSLIAHDKLSSLGLPLYTIIPSSLPMLLRPTVAQRPLLTLALAASASLRLSSPQIATGSFALAAQHHNHNQQQSPLQFIPSSPPTRNYSMGSNSSTAANFPKGKSDTEWRAQLSPEQFRVLRQKGTEPGFTGKYDSHYPKKGVYTCAGCDSPLYTADLKFKSGCGWPAFFDAVPGAIDRHVDRTFGMKRTEITCKACGGHLGHVFEGEGFNNPTDEVSSLHQMSGRRIHVLV